MIGTSWSDVKIVAFRITLQWSRMSSMWKSMKVWSSGAKIDFFTRSSPKQSIYFEKNKMEKGRSHLKMLFIIKNGVRTSSKSDKFILLYSHPIIILYSPYNHTGKSCIEKRLVIFFGNLNFAFFQEVLTPKHGHFLNEKVKKIKK